MCVRVYVYILLDVSFLPGAVFSNNFPSLLPSPPFYTHLLCDAQVFFHEWTDEEGERGEAQRWWWCQKAQREKSQYFNAAQLYIDIDILFSYTSTLPTGPLLLSSIWGCHSNALPYRILLSSPSFTHVHITRSSSGGGGIPTTHSLMNNPCEGS